MAKVKFQTTKIGEVILEATTQPDGQTLIDSWSLNQLAQSKEMRELGFEVVDYSFPFINAGSATCILKCRDKNGMLPMAIGEANRGNLTNEISKNLPHTMAYKRALDRAIIEYLGIGDGDRKRLYSDAEIEAGDVIAPVEEIPYTEAELPEIPEEVTTVAEEVVEEPQEEVKSNEKEEILAYKVKIGTQKGKTIESLLDNGSLIQTLANPKEEGGKTKYVVWLIENNPTRQELIELKDNLLKLKEIEEKEGE